MATTYLYDLDRKVLCIYWGISPGAYMMTLSDMPMPRAVNLARAHDIRKFDMQFGSGTGEELAKSRFNMARKFLPPTCDMTLIDIRPTELYEEEE